MMKVLLIDNLILKLILPTFRLDAPMDGWIDWMLQSSPSRPEEDWSIQSKRRQDKFQDQIVYQENLHHFICLPLFIPLFFDSSRLKVTVNSLHG